MSPSQDMPGLYSVVVCLLIFGRGSESKLGSYKNIMLDKVDVLVLGIVVEVKGRGKGVQEDGAAVKCEK